MKFFPVTLQSVMQDLVYSLFNDTSFIAEQILCGKSMINQAVGVEIPFTLNN